jgi:hypothetical protein
MEFQRHEKEPSNSRTIRSHQPPGSSAIEEALLWPQLALNFATTFLSATLLDPTQTPTLDEFRRFLKEGLSLTRNIDQGVIDKLLTGKTKLDEGPLEEESLSAEELELARAKERRGGEAKQELQMALMELSSDKLLDDDYP